MNYAFEINKLGSSKFPLTYHYNNFGYYHSLNIAALSLSEISDLILKYSFQNLLIFGVSHYILKNKSEFYTISEIADMNEVKYSKYDNENIAINKNELNKLIDFAHYNFKIFDIKKIPNELEYIELIDKIEEQKYEIVERNINDSNLWIDIHDDCYLYVESKFYELINEIILRAIETLIKSNIKNNIDEIKYSETVYNFLKGNSEVTIFNEYKNNNGTILFPIINKSFPWSGKQNKNKIYTENEVKNYLEYDIDKKETNIIYRA